MSAIVYFTQRMLRDSLFRNSFYLMIATAVLAGFGFFFWLIAAKLFTTEEIGLATALISVMNLISYLSLMGFSVAFVRFLPSSPNPNAKLNTGLLMVAVASLGLSVIFVVFVQRISPHLLFVHSPWVASTFVLFSVMSALNVLTDAVFLAYRQPKYTLIINTLFSIIKLMLPFAFFAWGAFGIFSAAALAQGVGFVLSVWVMIARFNYRPALVIDWSVLRQVWHYCASNYVASILNLLPLTLLPIIITNNLGPASAAYYYIAMMIGNLLYVIPWAATRSLFAEGSNDEVSLLVNSKKAATMISSLLIPAVVILLAFGAVILRIFGKEYALGGLSLLWLVALSAFAVTGMAVFNSIFQVKKNLYAIIITNFTLATSTIALTVLLLPLGLFGVGIAWLCGNSIASIVGYLLYRGPAITTRMEKVIYTPRSILISKLHYLRARAKRGFSRQAILFYPYKPRYWHILYTICHELGLSITNDTEDTFVLAVAFEDTTVRAEYPMLEAVRKTHTVINIDCKDISKERVDRIFTEVFGYSSLVDPRTYRGQCVQKSNANATHDGVLVECPTEPLPGYIYQKYIESEHEGSVVDIRVPIFNGEIPFLPIKHKSKDDRFDLTEGVVMAKVADMLRPREVEQILQFCKKFGLECGELDVLRDKHDQKIYITDANNSSGGPMADKHMSKKEYREYIQSLTQQFASSYGIGADRKEPTRYSPPAVTLGKRTTLPS